MLVRHEISFAKGVRILIADDEKGCANAFAELVAACGHEVVDVVSSGLAAIRAYHRTRPDLVLMDYQMAGLNGLTACRNILSSDPAGKIVFVCALLDAVNVPAEGGAVAVLRKPVGLQQLRELFVRLGKGEKSLASAA